MSQICKTLLGIICFVYLPSCSRKPAVEDHRSQKDIEALLIDIQTQTNESHEFFGDGHARTLRKILSNDNTRADPGKFLQTSIYLGVAEIDLGNLEEGIQILSAAHQLLANTDGCHPWPDHR
jgi:hypothetical protein